MVLSISLFSCEFNEGFEFILVEEGLIRFPAGTFSYIVIRIHSSGHICVAVFFVFFLMVEGISFPCLSAVI